MISRPPGALFPASDKWSLARRFVAALVAKPMTDGRSEARANIPTFLGYERNTAPAVGLGLYCPITVQICSGICALCSVAGNANVPHNVSLIARGPDLLSLDAHLLLRDHINWRGSISGSVIRSRLCNGTTDDRTRGKSAYHSSCDGSTVATCLHRLCCRDHANRGSRRANNQSPFHELPHS